MSGSARRSGGAPSEWMLAPAGSGDSSEDASFEPSRGGGSSSYSDSGVGSLSVSGGGSGESEEEVEGGAPSRSLEAPRGAASLPSALLTGVTGDTTATERDWSDYMTSEADTEDGEGAQESGGEGEGPSIVGGGGALPPLPETQAVPPAPPQGVARRTRAHVSLAHYEIEQLEEFLTLEREPDFFLHENDGLEYAAFLEALNAPANPAAAHSLAGEDDESDCDYEELDPAAAAVAAQFRQQAAAAGAGARVVPSGGAHPQAQPQRRPRALPPRASRPQPPPPAAARSEREEEEAAPLPVHPHHAAPPPAPPPQAPLLPTALPALHAPAAARAAGAALLHAARSGHLSRLPSPEALAALIAQQLLLRGIRPDDLTLAAVEDHLAPGELLPPGTRLHVAAAAEAGAEAALRGLPQGPTASAPMALTLPETLPGGPSAAQAQGAGLAAAAPPPLPPPRVASVRFDARFTALQLRCLHKQMHEHAQLLLQVHALTARAPGGAHAAAAAATRGMLEGLAFARRCALAACACDGGRARYEAALFRGAVAGPLYCGPGGGLAAQHAAEPQLKAMRMVEAWWPAAPVAPLQSMFDVPSVAWAPAFLEQVAAAPPAPAAALDDASLGPAEGDAQPPSAKRARRTPAVASLPPVPAAVCSALARFGVEGVSSRALTAVGSNACGHEFSPAEDRLLATGYHTFGNSWERVAAWLLPNKAPGSLANRWKNATGAARAAKGGRTGGAVLRAAKADAGAPLSRAEALALRCARVALLPRRAMSGAYAQEPKQAWARVAAHVWRVSRVRRPVLLLQRAWKELLDAHARADEAQQPQPPLEATPAGGARTEEQADAQQQQQQQQRQQAMSGADAALVHRSFLTAPLTCKPLTAAALKAQPKSPMERYDLLSLPLPAPGSIMGDGAQGAQDAADDTQPAAADAPDEQQPLVLDAAAAAPRRRARAAAARRGAGGRSHEAPRDVAPAMPAASVGLTALLDDLAGGGLRVPATGAPSWMPPLPALVEEDAVTMGEDGGGGGTSRRKQTRKQQPRTDASAPPPMPPPPPPPPPPRAAKRSRGDHPPGGSHGSKRRKRSRPAASAAAASVVVAPAPRKRSRAGPAHPSLILPFDDPFVSDVEQDEAQAAAAPVAAVSPAPPAAAGTLSRLTPTRRRTPRREPPPPPTLERAAVAALSSLGGGLARRPGYAAAAAAAAAAAPGVPPASLFEHDTLSDSDQEADVAPRRVTFAEEVLLDSDKEEEQHLEQPIAPTPIAPTPPPSLPRDNQLLFEGAMTLWSPAEDRALIVAARAAAGGRPSLATFAQAVSAAQGPLTGRSAALAQARYVALVRKMTAARASTQG